MIRMLVGMCVVLLAVACGSGEQSGAGREDNRVRLVLNWFPESQHGGYYAALVHGYYAEEGLEVEIQPGGVDIPVVQLVDTGRVTFGVTNADDVLIGRGEGADVVGVMAPLQMSPRAVIVLDDSPIREFADLRNITIAMSARAPFAHFLRANLPMESVRIVGYQGNVAPLLERQVDAIQGYSFSEPWIIRQRGGTPRNLMVSDLGYNPYTSMLITTRERIDANPDMVRRFVRASVRGWQKYLEDPDETNAAILARNPEMDRDILAFGVDMLRPLCVTDDVPLERVGSMSRERWDTLHRQLEDLQMIRAGSGSADAAFTTQFME